MFKDQGTHVDVDPVKIIFHPDRNRKQHIWTIINIHDFPTSPLPVADSTFS